MVKIISQNTRGLGDELKRRSVFYYLRDKGDILCLQETHSTPECEKLWSNEWGGKSCWSHGTSSSGGVGICLKKGVDIEVLHHEYDLDGRMCILQFKDKGEIFVLANLYGLNVDKPEFS